MEAVILDEAVGVTIGPGTGSADFGECGKFVGGVVSVRNEDMYPAVKELFPAKTISFPLFSIMAKVVIST